jgi:DNA gyrase/topoisomerase IV subunit A
MIATKMGKVCRFNEEKVRQMGRNAAVLLELTLQMTKVEIMK